MPAKQPRRVSKPSSAATTTHKQDSSIRKTVFVSYAHKDRKWADELLTFLAPWIRDKRCNLWDDSQIPPGAEWTHEIEQALEQATVAVLLVTSRFLNSDFIMNKELPRIVARAQKGQLRIAWVAVEHSAVEQTVLWKFQAVNDPKRPLASLTRSQRQETMVQIARHVGNSATMGTFAGSLNILDQTTEPLEAKVEGRAERKDRKHRVQVSYEPEKNQISFSGAPEKITAADLERLPEEDREFIADLEDSLKRNYERWKTVRQGLGDAGGALDHEIERQLTRLAKLICDDLNSILDFLRKMHKYVLEDHYGRYRYICQQVGAS